MERGYNLMNRGDLTIEELCEINSLVNDPNLKLCRRDYQRSKAEDFRWIFGLDGICGTTTALKQIMKLACLGAALQELAKDAQSGGSDETMRTQHVSD